MKFARNLSILTVIITTLFSITCSNGDTDTILIFAAASLNDALQEIKVAYQSEHETKLTFSFGGSQNLARQISLGAKADVILSAGSSPIEFLDSRQLLDGRKYNVLTNELVVVVQSSIKDQINTLEDLETSNIKRIAIADPETAPAGIYALQALDNMDFNHDLSSKIVKGENVRIALTYVQRGNADAGLVYRTDAALARNLLVLDIIPLNVYDQILYIAAVQKSSHNLDQAIGFCEFLLTEKARTIFDNHGFSFP